MNANHTPGPWHWVNSLTDEPFNFDATWDGDGLPSLRTVHKFGENKTEVRDGGTYTSWSLPKFIVDAQEPFNNAADAELIASAPEMLAELTLLRAEIAELRAEREAMAKQEPCAWVSVLGEYGHIEWGARKPDDNIHTVPLFASPVPIPEGYALVPKEPTLAMREAGHAAYYEELGAGLIDAYKAMLAAAPKHPTSTEGGAGDD